MTSAVAPLTPAAPPDERERRIRLDRMKRMATGMLVAATIIYLISRALETAHPWLGWIRAAAEAAMVGGLADWFAVTALFRRPMGLPIPHTGIIPAKKDRVGRTLGMFIQRNFMSRDVITSKLRAANVAERLARWLADPDNSRLIAKHVVHGLARGAQIARDDDVQALIDRSLRERVLATKVAPLIGNVLSLITADDRHQELLDEAIKLLARAVSENKDLIRERIEAESPWWVPDAVDDRIHRKIVNGIDNTLRDIRDHPQHPLRVRFDSALRLFIDNLHNSPEVQARAEHLKEELLEADAVRRFSRSLWTDAKDALLRHAEEGKEFGAIERALTSIGDTLLRDPAMLSKAEAAITEVTIFVVERYQDEVGDLIANTVAAWDPEVTSQRIELAIGRDLQFIRINGTVVGALAGVAIYALSKLMK